MLHYGLLWQVPGTDYSFDKHWHYDFNPLVCPPWVIGCDGGGGGGGGDGDAGAGGGTRCAAAVVVVVVVVVVVHHCAVSASGGGLRLQLLPTKLPAPPPPPPLARTPPLPPRSENSRASKSGLFAHPPAPRSFKTTGVALLKDLMSVQVQITLNAAFCERHRKNCPPSDELERECGKVRCAGGGGGGFGGLLDLQRSAGTTSVCSAGKATAPAATLAASTPPHTHLPPLLPPSQAEALMAEFDEVYAAFAHTLPDPCRDTGGWVGGWVDGWVWGSAVGGQGRKAVGQAAGGNGCDCPLPPPVPPCGAGRQAPLLPLVCAAYHLLTPPSLPAPTCLSLLPRFLSDP